MIIEASKAFGIDLHDESITIEANRQFPSISDGTLEIDFRRCIVDYEATSKIMDAAIERLGRLPEPRILIAKVDIDFEERLYLKWFFLGSTTLSLTKETRTDGDIRDMVIAGFRQRKIVCQLRIVDPETNAEVRTFTYGD